MKKTSLLISAALLGAGVATVPAISNSVHAATAQTENVPADANTGTLTVAAGKTMPVYSAAGAQTPINGKSLAAKSSWKYFDQKVIDGTLWINLGGNQWVNGSDKSAFTVTTPDDVATPISTSGTATVAAGQTVSVYASPYATAPVKTIAGGSKGVTLSYTAQLNYGGLFWIKVGTNEWINSSNPNAWQLNTSSTPAKSTSSTTTSETITATGKISILKGHSFPVYSSPSSTKPITGKVLKGGTSWKFFHELTYRGYLWYHLGGNQWINDSDVNGLAVTPSGTATTTTATSKTPAKTTTTSTKSSSNALKTTAISGSVKVNYVPGYGIAIWTSPVNGTPVPGKKLMHGTSWKVFQETTVNGNTYYNLGGAQWIDAHYVIANLNVKGKETAFSGKITTGKKRINVYADVNGNKVTRTIGANVKLNAYGKINNGQLWYRIGPKEYVRAIDMK